MGALGVAGALSMRWNCFTAGHQILALPLGVTVADAALGTSDETSDWRTEYLIGAGVAIAVGAAGWERERRKRRKMLKQTIEHVYGLDSRSDLRHDVDDDEGFEALLRERIAVDQNQESMVWEDESFLPDVDPFGGSTRLRGAAVEAPAIACVAPRKTEQSRDTRHFSKPQRESRGGALWLGLSLIVAFFCLFQALPRWSPTDGLHSVRNRQSVASASFDTDVSADYRVGGENYTFFNIEDIRPNQLVLASNPATGQLEPRRVLQTFHRTTYHLRYLTFSSSSGARQTFETTDEHPFWSQGAARWIPAGDLEPGDRAIDPHGANPS